MTNQTKNKRDSFIFYRSFFMATKCLKNDEKSQFFDAICSYALDGEIGNLEGTAKGMFELVKPYIDGNYKPIEKGDRHWNWQNGKSKESAIIRQSSESKKWRKLVFEKDNYTCQKCFKKSEKLHAHHKKEFAKYPKLRFELSNGITLCIDCHRFIHSKAFNQRKPNRFF